MRQATYVTIQYVTIYFDKPTSVSFWIVTVEGREGLHKVNAKHVRARLGGNSYYADRRCIHPFRQSNAKKIALASESDRTTPEPPPKPELNDRERALAFFLS